MTSRTPRDGRTCLLGERDHPTFFHHDQAGAEVPPVFDDRRGGAQQRQHTVDRITRRDAIWPRSWFPGTENYGQRRIPGVDPPGDTPILQENHRLAVAKRTLPLGVRYAQDGNDLLPGRAQRERRALHGRAQARRRARPRSCGGRHGGPSRPRASFRGARSAFPAAAAGRRGRRWYWLELDVDAQRLPHVTDIDEVDSTRSSGSQGPSSLRTIRGSTGIAGGALLPSSFTSHAEIFSSAASRARWLIRTPPSFAAACSGRAHTHPDTSSRCVRDLCRGRHRGSRCQGRPRKSAYRGAVRLYKSPRTLPSPAKG